MHGPVALCARPAACCRTSCEPCVAPFGGPTRPRSTGCAHGTAPQRCSRLLHGPAAVPAACASPARPCSAGHEPRVPRQRRSGVPADPTVRSPGPAHPMAPPVGPVPGAAPSTSRAQLPAPPQRGGSSAHPGRPCLGRPGWAEGPGPVPVPAGRRFLPRHNWKAPGLLGAARGTGTPLVAAGSPWGRGDAWGKSSVFNVPDSRLFLKKTNRQNFVAQP